MKHGNVAPKNVDVDVDVANVRFPPIPLQTLVQIKVADGRELRPTPWAVRDLDYGRTAIVDHQTKAASDFRNESVGTIVPIGVLLTYPSEVVFHPTAASVSHT